jgi:hypothetical protein
MFYDLNWCFRHTDSLVITNLHLEIILAKLIPLNVSDIISGN